MVIWSVRQEMKDYFTTSAYHLEQFDIDIGISTAEMQF